MTARVDIGALGAFLAARLGTARVRLEPLGVPCAWPVYRGETAEGTALFVKLTDAANAARTLAFLAVAGTCPLVPRAILPDAPAFGPHALLCLEWKQTRRVNAEEMSDAQFASFCAGLRSFAAALAAYRGPVAPRDEDDPDRLYGVVADYAARHPLVGRLLKPLLALPPEARSLAGRRLVTIHGDLQPRNYGFAGDRLAAVFDFDDLTTGLACADAAYAFTERARRAELSAAARERLAELFRRMVAASDLPRDEWRLAVNHARLRIAARRLEKHPRSPFVAFDAARRDRPLAAFLRAVRTVFPAGAQGARLSNMV